MKQKTTHTTRTVQARLNNLEAHAVALTKFANKDETFAQSLSAHISLLPKQTSSGDSVNFEENPSIDLLVPEDQETALERTQWLVDRIIEKKLPGSASAAQFLGDWESIYPKGVTRQIVIGIVGVAIIGPTLGKLKRRKKMAIVVHEDLVKNGKKNLSLAVKINHCSIGLISKAIKIAQGNFKNIEPDIADWLFGEAQTMFHKASQKKINSIKNELDSLGVVSASTQNEKDKQIDVLAISPSVSNN